MFLHSPTKSGRIIICLVGAHRRAFGPLHSLQHHQRRIAFGRPVCLERFRVQDDSIIAILHQQIAVVALSVARAESPAVFESISSRPRRGSRVLSATAFAFAPILAAHTMVLAGMTGNRIWHSGAALSDCKIAIAAARTLAHLDGADAAYVFWLHADPGSPHRPA
jgi:hypothetical protein